MKKQRAWIYCRVAHPDAHALAIQQASLEAYAEANGFEIVESSSCVSAENYDETLGVQICMEHIKDKIWMLLGFLLQTAVHGIELEVQ